MSAALFATRHFRAEREGDWMRLEALLDRVEKGSLRRLSDDDLFELPRLYRATLSALSVARDTTLDASMIAYLESLSTRAYVVLNGCREPWGRQIAGFFREGWPRSVRALLPEVTLALALLILSAVGGYHLVRTDPAWFGALMADGMAQGRNMEASADFLRESLYGAPREGGLEVFAAMLFTHNSQVAFMSFALGFAFGIPTVMLAVQNGALAGAMYAVYVPHGLGWGLTGWLMIHGTTEIAAIALAMGAGLHIGRAVAFPGAASRIAAAGAAGRRAAIVMIGAVVMLLVAGLLEGFGRQLIRTDSARFAIALAMLTLWVVYFGLGGRRRG